MSFVNFLFSSCNSIQIYLYKMKCLLNMFRTSWIGIKKSLSYVNNYSSLSFHLKTNACGNIGGFEVVLTFNLFI